MTVANIDVCANEVSREKGKAKQTSQLATPRTALSFKGKKKNCLKVGLKLTTLCSLGRF